MPSILYSSISGQAVGGGQQSLLLLLKSINRSLYHPVLVCPDRGDFVDTAESLGVTTEIVPMPRLAALRVRSILKLISIIRKYHISIIHADSARQVFYLGMAARLAHIPLLWHIRVGDRGNPLYESFLRLLSTKIVAVSQAAASRFGESSTKIAVIHNAVDTDLFSPKTSGETIRSEFNIRDSIIVGTMGQLLPKKGQDIFIRAAAEVAIRSKGNIAFMIVGRGRTEYELSLKKLAAECGILASTIFTGFRTDIPQIMAAFDIFVLATSYIEGLSRVIIEAMAAGKPVIATDIGGNHEALIDGVTGKLIPLNNKAALAEAMQMLIEDKSRRRIWGENGRNVTLERFNARTITAAIEKEYAGLI